MYSFKVINIKSLVPRILELLPDKQGRRYSWAAFAKDCAAGVIVGIVALPLSMAFSIAAGGTPAQGLYTAITAGFCVSLLGGSKFQIGGPTGAFVVIIFGVIERHGPAGLITATILAGLMLVVMGLTGLGRFIKFIPYPVTTGFTTGIGVLIFSQQVKDFFGLEIARSSPAFFEKWMEYIRYFPTFHLLTAGIGAGTMLIILLVRTFLPRIPAAALGVAAATAACRLLDLPLETIGSKFGGIPASLPLPHFPQLSWHLLGAVFPSAFTIALLAAIESLLSAVVADGMTGDRHNANMELTAQGLGNIVSGIFGGIPATGAIARTATNIKAGAVSPVAGIMHVLTLAVFVLFLSPLASAIPLAGLSAVLMIVSWDMSNLGRFVRLIRRAPKSDAGVLLTTFLLTIIVDLTFAVEVGVVLAVFLFLRRMIEVTDIKLENDELITELAFGDIGKRTASEIGALARKDIEIYEIHGPFFFGVADMLQNTLRKVAKAPKALILRMRDVPAVDSTGISALESFLIQCRRQKMRLLICEIRKGPRAVLEKSGFIEDLGAENILETVEEAIEQAGPP
ncbi:MAG: STAS domain-containing protein [Spirochaetaceae bacterium]|jgi:SulP family sulfate permease|nr:STAS domain-containing protein [Spirochaetaceae bacterium]